MFALHGIFVQQIPNNWKYMLICISIQFEWIAYNIWQAKCKSIYLIFVWRKGNKIFFLNFYRKQLKIHRLLFKQINKKQTQRERKYVYQEFSQLCWTVSSKLTLNDVYLKFKSIKPYVFLFMNIYWLNSTPFESNTR